MKNKLFHVLVVGGAALLGSQGPVRAEGVEQPNFEVSDKDPIFCVDDSACPKDATGKRQVKEGFECCWGTSCETIDE